MESSAEVKEDGDDNSDDCHGSSGECYREEFVRRVSSWLGGVRKN